jgi:outer membrane lipoprotein
MKRKQCFEFLIILSLLSWLTGCAHVISSEMRGAARKDLPFSAVLANPRAYEGVVVIWGGQVIDTLNEEGLTLIKVLQIPLDYAEMPEDEEGSQGRFIARVDGYADPEVYRKGRMLTLAGKIAGKKIEPLGSMEYVYPLVDVKEIHLWKQYYGPYGGASPPYWNSGYPYPFGRPYWWGSPFLF